MKINVSICHTLGWSETHFQPLSYKPNYYYYVIITLHVKSKIVYCSVKSCMMVFQKYF